MRLLSRILLILAILMVIIVAGGAGVVTYSMRRMLPQTDGTLDVAGLDSKVTIYRDAAGVPQIYATTIHDLFFAQGFVHAQDRWWQMEFNRHIGMGRISELVGMNDSVLAADTFIRTVGFNRAAQADIDSAPPGTLSIVNAYSEGVNAYLAGKSGPDLAVEYSILGLKGIRIPIEKWQPVHTLAYGKSMAWYLSGNMNSELDHTTLYKTLDPQWVDQFYDPPYPFDRQHTILRADDLPDRIGTEVKSNSGGEWADVQTALVGGYRPGDFSPFGSGLGVGSNNWAISGKLTASGKPILANDPHISIQMPAIWYENGLHCITLSNDCPYDVEGFSFPASPGVIIGHNQNIAWGATNVGPDVQDLYAIKVDPNDDTKYELDGKLVPMQIITEKIRFGDSTPAKDIRVRMTHFGPIVTDAPSMSKNSDKPLALHWTSTAERESLFSAIDGIDRATDWASFRQALKSWESPSQNFVYADKDGNIGYQMPGRIPIRAPNHSGLVPVDGSTTRNDWKGYVPFDDLPSVENPPRGFIASANNAVVPPAYYGWLATQLGDQYGKDANYIFSQEWEFGYRAGRITDLITGQDKHTIDTVKAIQSDVVNYAARDILPFALKLDYGSDVPKDVIAWMGRWDYNERMDTGQAALYEAFFVQLVRRIWEKRTGLMPDGTNIDWGIRLLLDQPDHPLWGDSDAPDKKQTRDDVVRAAFVSAYQEMSKRLGTDYKAWKW
ncbi:MAG TPA: penicillin acylase family protein, partial [Aggregatilineales bacterium]|nr:penicillin acylase family protein [Aggregatilineales bacterium]